MTGTRMRVIPFNLTNHGSQENFYCYTVYHRFDKGANRLCSTLYHYLRRLKFHQPEECRQNSCGQRGGRTLVLMADNYAENKNNTLFAFCSELILRGWFDEVQLLFGPVGHTHNGNDAVHYTHNQIAGDQVSVTLAEFFSACTVPVMFFNSLFVNRGSPKFEVSSKDSTIILPLECDDRECIMFSVSRHRRTSA